MSHLCRQWWCSLHGIIISSLSSSLPSINRFGREGRTKQFFYFNLLFFIVNTVFYLYIVQTFFSSPGHKWRSQRLNSLRKLISHDILLFIKYAILLKRQWRKTDIAYVKLLSEGKGLPYKLLNCNNEVFSRNRSP